MSINSEEFKKWRLLPTNIEVQQMNIGVKDEVIHSPSILSCHHQYQQQQQQQQQKSQCDDVKEIPTTSSTTSKPSTSINGIEKSTEAAASKTDIADADTETESLDGQDFKSWMNSIDFQSKYSDESTYDSYHQRETDYCRSSEDELSDNNSSIASIEVVEYEVASSSDHEALYSHDSSSGSDDFFITSIVTTTGRQIRNGQSCNSEFADTEDSNDSYDPELSHADYWQCVKCKNKQNNPMFRYCEKCYQIRKSHFPPRPRHRKSKKKTNNAKNEDNAGLNSSIVNTVSVTPQTSFSSECSTCPSIDATENNVESKNRLIAENSLEIQQSTSNDIRNRSNNFKRQISSNSRNTSVAAASGALSSSLDSTSCSEMEVEFEFSMNSSSNKKGSNSNSNYGYGNNSNRKRKLSLNKSKTNSDISSFLINKSNNTDPNLDSDSNTDSCSTKKRKVLDLDVSEKNENIDNDEVISKVINKESSSSLLSSPSPANHTNVKNEILVNNQNSIIRTVKFTSTIHNFSENSNCGYTQPSQPFFSPQSQKDSGFSSAPPSSQEMPGCTSSSSLSCSDAPKIIDNFSKDTDLISDGDETICDDDDDDDDSDHEIKETFKKSEIEINSSKPSSSSSLIAITLPESTSVQKSISNYNHIERIPTPIIKRSNTDIWSASTNNNYDVKKDFEENQIQIEKDSVQNSTPTNGSSSSDDLCVVCYTEPKNGAFIHTKFAHLCCCYKCAVKIWNTRRKCPVCNCSVKNVLKLFVH